MAWQVKFLIFAKNTTMLELSITPTFSDIDGLHHVNNNIITRWFEQARHPLYHVFNPDYDFKNWNLILARTEADFIDQVFVMPEVLIRTWILRVGRSSVDVYQEAWQDGRLCARGKVVLVHYDFQSRVSMEIPQSMRNMLNIHLFDDVRVNHN